MCTVLYAKARASFSVPTCINNSDKKNLGHFKDLAPGAKRKEETGIPLGREEGYTHPHPPGRTNRV